MVSLQLSKRLQPVVELLQLNILSKLPLEHFGLDMGRLVDLFATAPAKLSAWNVQHRPMYWKSNYGRNR